MSYTQNPSSIPVTASDDPHDTLHDISCVISTLGALLQNRTLDDLDAMGTRDGRPIRGLSIILENTGDLLFQTKEHLEAERRQNDLSHHLNRDGLLIEGKICSQLLQTTHRHLLMGVLDRLVEDAARPASERLPYDALFADMKQAVAEAKADERQQIMDMEEALKDVPLAGSVETPDGAIKAA